MQTSHVLSRGLSVLPARRRTTLALLAIALVVGVLTVSGFARGTGADRCQRFASARATRAAHDSGAARSTARRTVVIGDSWSAGLGLDDPDSSWPSRLPGPVHVDGFSGSGFSERASTCGRVSFADRAARAVAGGAALVVVEGGLNDYDHSDAEIRAGFARLMRVLGDREVVVVGPASAPSRARQVPRVVATLRSLAQEYGVRFVDTSDLRLPYLDDRLHLTPAGHRAFGDAVAARL